MIAVEFYDFNVRPQMLRDGKLLQIARGANMNDNDYMAFVITSKMDHDAGHPHMFKPGDKIILPVKLQYVRVKGTSIPLFGS